MKFGSGKQNLSESDSRLPSTHRQHEVLKAVLELMVEAGGGFSMAEVAKRASCSKETIYKWFGDRDGLLTATVRWQAAKVQMPEMAPEGMTEKRFAAALESFAESWLTVITGEVSIALNRLAISHAGSGQSALGTIVAQNGPIEMARRLDPIFRLGREAGILRFDDSEQPFRTFFGLVVGDVQIRILLGDRAAVSDAGAIAKRAVNQFLRLFGATETDIDLIK